MIDRKKIKNFTKNASRQVDITTYSTTDSTNLRAKEIAKNGYTCDTVIIAEEQTAGRGRLGRSFYSPAKTGIYMSYLYYAGNGVAGDVAVTSAAAVAVVRAVRKVLGIETGIKWVNDIYLNGKKVCGILTESVENSGVSSIIVGIGLNVSTNDFPVDIKNKAGSLCDSSIDRNLLAAEIVNELSELINGLENRTFIDEYRAASLVTGKEVVYTKNGISCEATATSIGDNGELIVTDSSGKRTVLCSGEISLKISE